MKKISLSLIVWVLLLSTAFAQSPDEILGKWQSAHGNGKIQIYKRGEAYFGKIIWLNEPKDDEGHLKTDKNNPEKELQPRPIIGLDILKDFSYKGNNVWSNGKIYDPKSGNTYNCQMSIADKEKLNIRAYFGLSVLGKTEIWTKVDD